MLLKRMRQDCIGMEREISSVHAARYFPPIDRCLKKNQNTPRPSEHPPVMGESFSRPRASGIGQRIVQYAECERQKTLDTKD